MANSIVATRIPQSKLLQRMLLWRNFYVFCVSFWYALLTDDCEMVTNRPLYQGNTPAATAHVRTIPTEVTQPGQLIVVCTRL